MYLKSLEVLNFKSFKGEVTVPFWTWFYGHHRAQRFWKIELR